jgi:hypothetical protein
MPRLGLALGIENNLRRLGVDPSVFDGGSITAYTGAVSNDAGDALGIGTLPGRPFANADVDGARVLRGAWRITATKNGTIRGLLVSSADHTIKVFLTVGTSGTDVIIDHTDVQIGNTITVLTMDWTGVDGGTAYPNLPADYLSSKEIDFSDSVPAIVVDSDRAIGSTGWVAFNGADTDPFTPWVQTSDASAPQSPPSTWVGHWVPGTYSDGHGIGNVGAAIPNVTRLYASVRVLYDFPDLSYWHAVSNKFVNIETDFGLILVQLKEGSNYRHAEELGNFAIDSTPGNLAGQLSNGAVPVNQWVQIEVLIDLPNRIFKVWQDGVLTTSTTSAPFAATRMSAFSINAHRGGGGETLSADLYYKYDHFHVAW